MTIGRLDAQDVLHEWLSPDAGYFLRAGRLLESGETPFQRYEVWQTSAFGTLFRLDGCFMTSEHDEYLYHENLIHVAGTVHQDLQRALIIGGGDGGSAEELLKYPGMTHVVLVELDGKVIDIARKYLQTVHRGSLDDPRLSLHLADGLEYVRRTAPAADQRFDLVVLDLTDPIGPAEALYSEAFFADCRALLNPGGALSLHIGAPLHHPERVAELLSRLRTVFARVQPYFTYIPLYGAQWGFAIASDTLDPLAIAPQELDQRIRSRGITHLQHYNGAIHHAQFALPNRFRYLAQP